MIPHTLTALRWLDGNPFASLAVPPVLLIIQFLDLLLLFRVGLPQSMADTHGKAALCILFLFALSLISIPALMLAVRQVFLLPNKVAPSLAILANGCYFVGFVFFFVLCFVVRTFT
ncbi:MAG: hypothetical protein JF616_11800 [Fibrobacteres bacterium]|nr:hypothetical protein [Fibrobacterota bacterium]